MKKSVVLLSGGLDSLVCLALAKKQGDTCFCLTFDYGQKHRVEVEAAKKIAKCYSVADHIVVPFDLRQFGGSALTDDAIKVPHFSLENKQDLQNKIKATYVPARNTVFLAAALGYAEVLTADAIIFAANALDYEGFPDTRPEYLQAFEQMANLATKAGVEGKKIKIETPLLSMDKTAIINLGQTLNVDFSLSISCYQANKLNQACGYCDSCYLRLEGFKLAGIQDPAQFIKATDNEQREFVNNLE